MNKMRIHLGLVSETNKRFLNQVKLCLHSLRKNGGALKDIPITLITNNKPIGTEDKRFLKKHFSPIEFKVMPRLGAVPQASKLNIFYAIEPASYDVLLYLDCDTVVRKPLDQIIDPIKFEGVQFLCRRGGKTDRNRFVDFDALVSKFCGKDCKNKVYFEGEKEWPMFNTGVFVATSEAVCEMRKDSVDFTYLLFNQWQRINAIENARFIKYLYRYKALKTKQKILDSWTIEQGALALACIKAGIKIGYLDEAYNSWGNIDFKILHCFKSAYKFNRKAMFSDESARWIKEYEHSQLSGKMVLAKITSEFKQKYNK